MGLRLFILWTWAVPAFVVSTSVAAALAVSTPTHPYRGGFALADADVATVVMSAHH
jgi:hypothetical protein